MLINMQPSGLCAAGTSRLLAMPALLFSVPGFHTRYVSRERTEADHWPLLPSGVRGDKGSFRCYQDLAQ